MEGCLHLAVPPQATFTRSRLGRIWTSFLLAISFSIVDFKSICRKNSTSRCSITFKSRLICPGFLWHWIRIATFINTFLLPMSMKSLVYLLSKPVGQYAYHCMGHRAGYIFPSIGPSVLQHPPVELQHGLGIASSPSPCIHILRHSHI